MRLTKKVEYGIMALVHLTQRTRTERAFLQSREIAEHENMPGKFLESILLALKSGEILESKVGAGGGYRLIRDPQDLYLTEVIQAMEAQDQPDESIPAPIEPPVILNPADAPGREALGVINDRMDAAFLTAVGSLTLAELIGLVAERMPATR